MLDKADDEAIYNDGRTTSMGLWRYAFEYLKAAKTLDEVDSNPWFASSVSYQCVCQGLELAFKAYLRARGLTLDDLKALGHSISKSMEAAVANGLPKLVPDHSAAIGKIDIYYAQHEFRYIVTGLKDYPSIGTLLAAGVTVLDTTSEAIAHDAGSEGLAYRMRLNTSATFGVTPPPR